MNEDVVTMNMMRYVICNDNFFVLELLMISFIFYYILKVTLQ